MSRRVTITQMSYPLAFDPRGRKPRSGGMDLDRWTWKRDHPLQWAWVKSQHEYSSFAVSICRALHEFGVPTRAQQAALDRIIREEEV